MGRELGNYSFWAKCPIKGSNYGRDVLVRYIRDWSLFRWRGAIKWENRGSETFCAPSQDRGKLFAPPPLLKSGNLLPPFNMTKTPVLKLLQNFVWPPPFSMAKTSHAPLPFCSPLLPVISDQSLTQTSPWEVYGQGQI